MLSYTIRQVPPTSTFILIKPNHRKKHQDGVKLGKFPKASDVADPVIVDENNVVTSTPIDRVYEHGFYPLKDAFRANVTGKPGMDGVQLPAPHRRESIGV
jgi:hypothetical protein